MSQRKFDTLTPAGQRVRIAKDVIDQLTKKKIKARTGVYLSLGGEVTLGSMGESSARDVLASVRCEACALGSLFVSSVHIKNGLLASETFVNSSVYDEVADIINGVVSCDTSVMRERLEEYFDEQQLDLIESAFETSDMGDGTIDSVLLDRAIQFGARYNDHTRRMKAIMQNVIDYRGTFVP